MTQNQNQKQNINLIDELDLLSISVFNSKIIAEISIGWILLLVLAYLLAVGSNTDKKKELAKLEFTQQSLKEKIEKYEQESFTVRGKTTDLKKISTKSTNSTGFYQSLKDLAEFTPSGTWLNNIIISEPNNITIKGNAITPLGVSTLIKSLNKSNSFRNKKFGKLQLQKNTKSKVVSFTISTIHPDTNKAGGNPKKTGSTKTK